MLGTGGSSSGAGTNVSFWLGNVGTETSGSILSPAHANMLVGIKPTLGLVSRTGIIPIAQNEYPLARGKVRYMGEPVAAVAAVDAATAEQALALIRLELRELPSYTTAAEARSPAAVLLHDDKPGNLEREVDNCFGDVEAGFAAADLIREKTFHCAEVTHVHIEPPR